MSSENMRCDECRDALTELVCDELSPDARAKVEEHVRGCAECARALSRMQRVMTTTRDLPMEEPSKALRNAVMAHAREALQRNAATAKAEGNAAGGEGGWGGLLAWLSRLAMAPQVAMAAVLLLVVGIGFYALPFGADEPQAALVASESAPASPTPAASATAVPMRDAPPEPSKDEGALPAQPSPEDLAERASKSEERYAKAPLPRSDGDAKMKASRAALKPRSASKGELEMADPWESGGGMGAASSEPAKRPASSGAGLERKRAANVDDYAPAPAPAAQAIDTASRAPASRAEQTSRAEEGAPPVDALEEGVRAAQSGRYEEAIKYLSLALRQGGSSDQQKARLWLARSYRLRGDCASALRYYEPFVKAKGASAEVLTEAASCYERVGDRAQATALRARTTKSATPPQPSGASPGGPAESNVEKK